MLNAPKRFLPLLPKVKTCTFKLAVIHFLSLPAEILNVCEMLCEAVWDKRAFTSDSYGEDRRTVSSDSIPRLTVVLTALSRTDLRDGEDRTGLGAPCCTERVVKGCWQIQTNSHPEAHTHTYLTDSKHFQQIKEFGVNDFVMLPLSWTTFLRC